MRNVKTLILLAIITGGLFLTALLYRPHHTSINTGTDNGPLVPGLLQQLNAVQKIRILHAGETVTLAQTTGKWTVTEKANYPAQEDQVRELLTGLAHAARVEPKTRNPENYAALGLKDLDKSGTEGSRIELFDKVEKSIAKVTVGKRKPALDTGKSDFYALVKDDPQTWLVEGRMPAIGAAGAWLHRTILELERNRIADITLIHSDGETLHIKPKEPDQTKMFLEGLKPDETMQNDYALDDIADRFTLMQMEDVQQADKLTWPTKSDLTLEVRAKNGLVVTVAMAKIDNQTWLKFSATAPPDKNDAAKKDATKKDAAPVAKTSHQEATELNARWKNWAYTLADWAYQTLNKRRADLVKPPKPPKPAAEPTKPIENTVPATEVEIP